VKRFVASTLFVLGMACQSSADVPTDPVWGKQACSSCAMLVSGPRFAAQILTAQGDHLYFDDVGCMATFLARHKDAPSHAWVRDAKGNWVTADRARFSKGARTPMDYGFEFSETGPLSWTAVEEAARERLARGSER